MIIMDNDSVVDVLRHDLTGRGYILLDEGFIDSKLLRRRMLEIKNQLPKRHAGIYSATRFDQQETTRFHQDGGPDDNILLLGYEPSKVKSHLFIADHTCAANDLNVTPEYLMNEAMMGRDKWLENYTTELPPFEENHSYILVINNSKNLGVMHKAAIPDKNLKEKRVINSVMLSGRQDVFSLDKQLEFLTTDEVKMGYEKK